MLDATLTASAIAALASQKFVEAGAGELATKFTTEAIAKMDLLFKRIWSKLQGKPRIEAVKATIDQTHKITPEQINQIAAYLQVAMDEDAQFANDIRLLAQEIDAGKLIDQSRMTQINYDQAKGWQTKVESGTGYHVQQFTAVIQREDDGYVSLCPELDIASQGNTVEEARNNLIEAIELFFEAAHPSEIAARLKSEVFITRLEISVG